MKTGQCLLPTTAIYVDDSRIVVISEVGCGIEAWMGCVGGGSKKEGVGMDRMRKEESLSIAVVM
jgi:hypothetical protein